MKIEVYPTRFEAHDPETQDALFTVTLNEETTATVTIETIVNVEEWDAISASIRECLVAMRLEGDSHGS